MFIIKEHRRRGSSSGPVSAEEIRQRIIDDILKGKLADGSKLPSTRQLSSENGAHCQTVAKAYRPMLDSGVVEKRAGLGMFIASGGSAKLLELERLRFVTDDWKAFKRKMSRLGIRVEDLPALEAAHKVDTASSDGPGTFAPSGDESAL